MEVTVKLIYLCRAQDLQRLMLNTHLRSYGLTSEQTLRYELHEFTFEYKYNSADYEYEFFCQFEHQIVFRVCSPLETKAGCQDEEGTVSTSTG